MKIKPYPRYKPSGVEWLGDVPEHWEVKKFTRNIDFQEGPGIMAVDFQDEGTPLLRIRNIQDKTVDLSNCNYLDPEKVSSNWKHFKCKKGDLLISGSASTGMVCEVTEESTGAIPYTGIIRLWPATKAICKDFIRWTVSSLSFESQISIYQAGSTIQHFGPEHLRKMRITLPSLPEQQAIAAFLDRQTGTIDALIARKQQLLELLKEQRTAMISSAVTKGLNPKVKMKPSGVEWLGDVPEHWKMKKMRYIFSFRSGGTPSTENPLFWDGHIPWVSSKDMKTFFIEDTEDHITEDAVKESATTIMPTGSLLVVMRSGILIHSIPASVIKYDMAINQDIKAFLPKFTISSIYYARFIEGYQKQLLTEWRKEGATVESLDMELINNFQILFPPFSEQQAIVEYLDRETGKIDALASKVETAIEKLKEYRTALISAAVTGKIDVREAV